MFAFPVSIAATSLGMVEAALVAAIAVGTRMRPDRRSPMTMAAFRPLMPRLRMSLAWSGWKQIARMIVHTNSPTKGSSSCMHKAIRRAISTSGRSTSTTLLVVRRSSS